MQYDVSKVINEMILYNGKDVRRINHALKVYSFASAIGKLEELDENQQFVLETAAILHDIGIKISEEKYNSASGGHQQIEGPPIARAMLEKLEFSNDVIDRVCYLIAHHHTYSNIEEKDYQILVEADFIVNINEGDMKPEQIQSIKNKIFRTKAGIHILSVIY